ncbi:MAG: hybrid sensor histidine kinase/response regulator [Hyphomicrobiales bacterium]|nr:hybrid sensor histidine kinase/response regulator [Hyphomicrobiales bacterium]
MAGPKQTAKPRRKYGRILVADDDPVLLELAASSLASGGYGIETARNGVEAIQKLSQHPFDIVITDLTMPEIDGFGLIEHIRLQERLQHIPVIVITTSDDYASIEHAFASGATSFVAKPINWSLFRHHVRYVMRSSRKEAELRLARNAAEAASRLKSNLLSVMTHEFRTPLHVVLGFTELFVKEADGPLGAPEYKEYAQHISDAAGQLNGILSDILLFSRAFSEKLTLQEDTYPIANLLADAVSSAKGKAAASGVTVVTAETVEPECRLVCDRSLLARALGHLIDNAIKFSPAGGRVSVSAELTSNDCLICSVKDDGCGMTAEQVGDLLKPFVQADMSRSRLYEGMGLGLTLCNYIIEAHGGRLIIHSSPGDGTTAGLIFPAQRVSHPAMAPERVAIA